MVRFRVIKGSRLLLGFAVVALTLVVCLLALKLFGGSAEPAVTTGGSLVTQAGMQEAETVQAAFASYASNNADIEISVLPQETGGQALLPLENEHTDQTVPPLELVPQQTAQIETSQRAPRVLIYHTHTHEAYEQTQDDPYEALEAWRTEDTQHSVVRVGAELSELLRARGCEVVHDTTDHEINDLSTAYVRSEETLASYEETFDLYIDLHRDAYIEGMGENALSVDGVDYAKLMLLIGKGDSFDLKPHYEENYAFATALTDELNARTPGICRDVLVKKNRYNQHFGPYAVLIEVGNNRNTLVEALNSAKPLADALCALLLERQG